jgi:hypothetical protein
MSWFFLTKFCEWLNITCKIAAISSFYLTHSRDWISIWNMHTTRIWDGVFMCILPAVTGVAFAILTSCELTLFSCLNYFLYIKQMQKKKIQKWPILLIHSINASLHVYLFGFRILNNITVTYTWDNNLSTRRKYSTSY